MNVGGAATFQFSTYHLLAGLPAVIGKAITSPVLFIGANTFLNGYATLETLQFTEVAQTGDNGTFYTWQITGFVPGDSPALADLIESMECCLQYIVVVKDMMNIKRLVGYNAPLTFIASYTPGNDTKSARGYTFTFAGTSPFRAPVYNV